MSSCAKASNRQTDARPTATYLPSRKQITTACCWENAATWWVRRCPEFEKLFAVFCPISTHLVTDEVNQVRTTAVAVAVVATCVEDFARQQLVALVGTKFAIG